MYVSRKPIAEGHKKFLNLLSFGKFGANQERMGYDQLYHLSIEVYLQDTAIRAEKNHVIQFSYFTFGGSLSSIIKGKLQGVIESASKTDPNTLQRMKVELGSSTLTFGQFIQNGLGFMGTGPFHKYDALSGNCQQWVHSMLKANGMLTKQLSEFILQEATELMKDMMYLKPLVDKVTGITTWFDKFVYN